MRLIKFNFFYVIIIIFNMNLFAENLEMNDFKYGMKLYNDKIYDVSTTQFQLFIENYPSSLKLPEVYFYLADSYRQQGMLTKAINNYSQIILNYAQSEVTEKSILNIAELYLKTEQKDKAANYYLQLKNFFPASSNIPFATHKGIKILTDLKKDKLAREHIISLKQRFPQNIYTIKSRLLECLILERNNNISLAENEYKKIIAQAPKEISVEVNYQFALFLIRQKRTNQAKIHFEKAVKNIGKEKPESYFLALKNYLKLLIESNEIEKAYKYIKNIKIPDNYKYEFKILEGEIAFFKQDYHKAYLTYVEVLEKMKKDDLIIKIAFCLDRQNKHQKAAQYIIDNLNLIKEIEMQRVATYQICIFARKAKDFYTYEYYLKKYIRIYQKDDPDIETIIFKFAKLLFDRQSYYESIYYFDMIISNFYTSELVDNASYYAAEASYRIGNYAQAFHYYNRIKTDFAASNFCPLIEKRLKDLIETGNIQKNYQNLVNNINDIFLKEHKDLYGWFIYLFQEAKNYPAASKVIEKMLKETNLSIDKKNYLMYGKAKCLEFSNVKEKAIIIYRNLFNSKDIKPELRNQLAYSLLENIKLLPKAEAESFLKKTIVQYPKDSQYMASLIEFYYKHKAFSKTIEQFKIFQSKFANSKSYDKVLFIAQEAYNSLKDYKNRNNLLNKLIAKKNSTYSYQALKNLVNISPAPEKITFLKQLKRDYFYTSDNINIDEEIAYTYLKMNKLKEALDIYIDLQNKIDKNSIKSIWNFSEKSYNLEIANIYFKKQEYDLAHSYFQKEINTNNSHNKLSALLKLGEIYTITDRKDELEHTLSVITKLATGKNRLNADLALADIDFYGKNYDNALKKYETIIKNTPPKEILEKAMLKQIQIYYRKNNIALGDKYVKNFRNKISNYNQNYIEPIFLIERGGSYLSLKKYDDALDEYEKLIDKFSKSILLPKALYGKSSVYYNIGKKEKAFMLWEQLVKEYPDNEIIVDAYYHLASVYYNKEEFHKSIQAFEAIINFPKDSKLKKYAYKNIIKLYNKLGFYDAQSASIRDYITRYPDEEDVFKKRITIGNIYQNNKQFDKAIEYFKTLLLEAKGEDKASVEYFIAETYMMQREYERAISGFLKVKYMIAPTSKLPWGVTATYQAALCYEQLGKKEQAIKLLEEIIKSHENDKYGKQAKKVLQRLQ